MLDLISTKNHARRSYRQVTEGFQRSTGIHNIKWAERED